MSRNPSFLRQIRIPEESEVFMSQIPVAKSGRLRGYVRVSTDGQTPALQLDALKAAGCVEIFEDTLSGAVRQRPGLTKAFEALASGDVLVVWKLDQLERSLSDLIALITKLGEMQCGFRSLTEAIDTSTPGGKLVFHVLGALAEFERSILTERTRAGLAAAKRRGARIGRKRQLGDSQVSHARTLLAAGERAASVARSLGVSKATLYRALARHQQASC
jgi:DNA invertase Pin-like site-specific DNA recombinase